MHRRQGAGNGRSNGFLSPQVGIRPTEIDKRASAPRSSSARHPPLAVGTATIRRAQLARRRWRMPWFRDSQPHSRAFWSTYHSAFAPGGHRTTPSTRRVQKSVSIPVACRRSVNAYALAVRELFEFPGVKQARHNFFIFILPLRGVDAGIGESPVSKVFSVTSPHDPHGESATGALLA